MTSNENWLQATEQEKEEIMLAHKEVDKFHRQEISLEELYEKFTDEKLRSMGIKIHMQEKIDFIEQVTFDEVLQMVENRRLVHVFGLRNQPFV